jgi:hypothetical protein
MGFEGLGDGDPLVGETGLADNFRCRIAPHLGSAIHGRKRRGRDAWRYEGGEDGRKRFHRCKTQTITRAGWTAGVRPISSIAYRQDKWGASLPWPESSTSDPRPGA